MNSKSNCRHRGKLLFTSVAAATLGLIIMSPDMAKADTLVDSAAAKKQVAQSSSLPASNNNQTAVSTDSAAANNNQASTTSEAATSNVAQPSTSPSSETQDSNEPPAAGEEAKGITPRSILTASWGGLKVTLDTATGIATIPGGTITNQNQKLFYQLFRDNDVYKSIKKIKITGPLKLVGSASWMFVWLSGLTEIEGLDQVDTSEVTTMNQMFNSCESLEHLDLSNFNTAKVTAMNSMFAGCYKLSNVDLHSFDTSKVTDMCFMFFGCTSLTSLDLSNFNTAKVTAMYSMFGNTNSLTSLDLSNFDTAKVTDMRNMFSNTNSLTSLDLSNFDTAKVTDMRDMFFGCQNLKTINISSFQMAQVTSKSEMLKSIPKLSTLVLGPKNYLRGTDLDATGVWLNVGNGTVDKPQGNKSWTSSQLMSNYSGSRDQDTYVRLGGAVTVHYLDEAGKKLAPDQILSGKIGDSYSSEPQDIAGYVLKTTPANAKGTYTDKVQEVTYVYTNQVKVLVHYVDQDGKPIADDETLSGKIGDDYPAKEIAGYVIQTKPSGKFSASVTEVTYVYTNQVKVLAHYVDQDGKPIADNETLTGKIGDDYPAKEIAGYVIQTKPAGKFSGTETEVTYVYTNQVKVLAHYVDQDGKPVAEDETLNGKIGDDYPDKTIAGYVVQTKPTGKFSGTETEVTYVYTNQVKVLAHYVDQDGKSIADDETLSGKIGDDYPAKEIAGYVIQTKPAGKFSGTEAEITYVYTNQVKVLAHYVDQDGKPIADDETISGKIGDDYPAKEIAGYVIKSKPSGKFSATVTEVTYVYTNQVKVLAHYVDQDGKPIADDETLSGKIGDDYPDKTIAGYVIQTKPTGKFSGTEAEVTYIYAKLVSVIAHYVDQDGKPIAGVTDETLSGKIGDPYPGSGVKDIPGYTLKTKPTGKFSSTETEVTYIYAKLVTVIAHYVDQDGKPIAGITDEQLTGAIGDPYPDSAVKDIKGYTLKTKPTGKFSGTETEVTYVYTKNASVNPGGAAGRQPIVGGSVTVHYQDETGKQLAPDQILTGNVGEGYLTQEVALAGYKLTQRPANATGFYTANPQSVTYIYTKNVTGQAAVRRTVFHNSYLYDQNGGRKTGKYLMGKTIWTYGTKVIQGKKYYDLGQDNYVKATNVSGVKRKLRRNSYIYSKTAKKLQRKALKRGQKVRTYGAAVKIHRKLYYIVGKNQYVKKSNF
ncbi:MucBP domain-containing protein [uncultured Lactobacillus sp.]|uniref:MucBP domain-containing protein n=1 Tax=uncultured Lactobacillus sp. TaxID=153152 RepID=UPI0025CCA4EC|nr:MucBP domain-containing protein [uncultured Lactobacillus sp.]